MQIYLSVFFCAADDKNYHCCSILQRRLLSLVFWVEPDWAAVILSVTTFATTPPLRFPPLYGHTRTAHYMYIIFRFYSFFFFFPGASPPLTLFSCVIQRGGSGDVRGKPTSLLCFLSFLPLTLTLILACLVCPSLYFSPSIQDVM